MLKVNASEDLLKIQERISLSLCHLEKIFPMFFLDMIEHLPIYLAKEALIAGPVQCQWLFFIEGYCNNVFTRIFLLYLCLTFFVIFFISFGYKELLTLKVCAKSSTSWGFNCLRVPYGGKYEFLLKLHWQGRNQK